MFIDPKTPRATTATAVVQSGDVDALKDLLAEDPELATAYIGDASEGRTLLHLVTDWPGHRPNSGGMIQALLSAGADVNAPFAGKHSETALHWAASNDDVVSLDTLLDAGANIEAGGGVVANGTPLADARVFLQLNAARRLVERGAAVSLHDAATLGLLDSVEGFYREDPPPGSGETDLAFWSACHGGQLPVAKFLYERGANIDTVPPWDEGTPLDAAKRSTTDTQGLVAWLQGLGAKTTQEPSSKEQADSVEPQKVN